MNKGGFLLIKLIPPPHVPIQMLSKESWNIHRALALERLRLSSPSWIYSRETCSGERNILCLRSSIVMPLSSEAIQSLPSFNCLIANIRLHKAAYLSFLLFLKVIKLWSATLKRARPLSVPSHILPFVSLVRHRTSLPGRLFGSPEWFWKFFTFLSLSERILNPWPTWPMYRFPSPPSSTVHVCSQDKAGTVFLL